MTRSPAVLTTLVLASLIAGCSSDSPTASSPTGSSGGPAASDDASGVCTSVDALQTSVTALGEVQVTENGVPALQDAVAAVETDLEEVVDAAASQYSSQVDRLQSAFAAVESAVGAAVDAPSASTLRVVGSSIGALADGVAGFAEDVGSTC